MSRYDNTDERGEDSVARQRGGSEPGHLPECFDTVPGLRACICDRLRACEARVREDERLTDRSGWYKTGWDDGYAACKDDAAKAVMALLTIASYGAAVGQVRDDALTVIDALRGQA